MKQLHIKIRSKTTASSSVKGSEKSDDEHEISLIMNTHLSLGWTV